MADSTNDQVLNYFQVACAAIAIYNSAEVLGLTLTTFTKYNTLYCKSILVCAAGTILFAGGFLDLFYYLYLNDGVTIYRPLIILTIGWYGMVTGFAVVMYSRLYLVNVPRQYINMVFYFIIYNIIFSHFPTTVLTFGANVVKSPEWKHGYSVMEKLQMTMFCIQEVILGALYLHYIRKMTLSKKTTALVRQTIYINVAVLCLDISMLLCEYIDLYNYQIMLKCAVYSIKLKMEFLILNILSRSLRQHQETSDTKGGHGHYFASSPENHQSTRAGNKKEIAPIAVVDENVKSGDGEQVYTYAESQSASAKGDA